MRASSLAPAICFFLYHAFVERGYAVLPVFSVAGWYDNFVEGDLAAFSVLRRTSGLH